MGLLLKHKSKSLTTNLNKATEQWTNAIWPLFYKKFALTQNPWSHTLNRGTLPLKIKIRGSMIKIQLSFEVRTLFKIDKD